MLHRGIAFFAAVILVAGGLYTAMSAPSIVNVDVPIENLSDAHQGLKIALITDVHIGPSVGRSRVQHIVGLTNELNPGSEDDDFCHLLKLYTHFCT